MSDRPLPDQKTEPPKPSNPMWLADQHRKQEERRCYVCGQRDAGGCDQVDGTRAECPWY